MRIKNGVRFHSLDVAMCIATVLINDVYREHGCECVITSGVDGVHHFNSLHPSGGALDFSTHTIPANLLEMVLASVRSRLGIAYDVILEDRAKPNEHLHVEYDPKVL